MVTLVFGIVGAVCVLCGFAIGLAVMKQLIKEIVTPLLDALQRSCKCDDADIVLGTECVACEALRVYEQTIKK